ncbi:MAG: hypothetical protein Q9223_004748, partial [Gallowayella weberi]
MFAVPGWEVPASKLKTQQESRTEEERRTSNGNVQPSADDKISKKRKRGHAKINGTDVTKDNLAELWQKYIEDKNPLYQGEARPEPPKQKKKRQRKKRDSDPLEPGRAKDIQNAEGENVPPQKTTENGNGLIKYSKAPTVTSAALQDGKPHTQEPKPKEQGKKAKPPKERARSSNNSTLAMQNDPLSNASPHQLPTASAAIPILPPAPLSLPQTTKLTPLQTAMRAKLISARFRHLNETIYTTPSTHAFTLFSTNSEAFDSYHAGFRAQVASWPSNPVDIFIKEIQMRGAVGGPRSQKQLFRAERKKKGGKKENSTNDILGGATEVPGDYGGGLVKLDPLPRHQGSKVSTIIDLGCGDAQLHASLVPSSQSLKLNLHSFDLAQGAGLNAHLITVSDIAHLPLPDGSADIAIFCLALMGTNWTDFVKEAARVVRVGGECWVGEVRSRFAGTKDLERLIIKSGEQKRKVRKKKDDEEEDADLQKLGPPIQVEEDDTTTEKGRQGKPKEQHTDVAPFLEVFRRRGFVLKGEVDMRNKMFLRMRFLRIKDSGSSELKRRDGTRFVEADHDGSMDPEVESKVLKPCVYKTR